MFNFIKHSSNNFCAEQRNYINILKNIYTKLIDVITFY